MTRSHNRSFLDYAFYRWPFCQWCGIELLRHQATTDHVHPLFWGGDNSWENLVVSCERCNQDKGCSIMDREPMGPRWSNPFEDELDWQSLVRPVRQVMSLGIIRAICGK